jgi:predicted enzyme related to lactoylglutathione lyase
LTLGSYAHISISVSSLETTMAFYENIGFKKLWENSEPKPWALLTDNRVNIHLYESYFPSPALHYFSAQMENVIRDVRRLGIRLEQHKSKDGARKQHTFFDPSEIAIMLMHHDAADMPTPSGESHSPLGEFGEFSIGTDSLRTSMDFWEQLEFTTLHKSDSPYPWAILSDGVMTIGLHQTQALASPALTYFSSDITARIAELEQRKIPFSFLKKSSGDETYGALVNAPDGQLFLLLKGDV